ncbi:hypothetical protein PspLS_09932 [Pyricularia sp. CBS 133598]|nr:hypothetical protein PspLS_09932 [Pyricularia sp. CBS 133598]
MSSQPKKRKSSPHGMSTEEVEHWKKEVHDGPRYDTGEERGIVHNLCDSISLLYEELLNHFDSGTKPPSKYPKSLYRLVESCYAKLKIWASDHSVSNGRLDQVLFMSRRLQNFTVEIMVAICVILTKGKSMHNLVPILHVEQGNETKSLKSVVELVSRSKEEADRHLEVAANYDESDAGSHVGSDAGSERGFYEESVETSPDSMEQILGNLELHVKDLMDLGPELKDPIPDIIDMQPARPFVVFSWENVSFCEQIHFRYPNIDPKLVEPCGKFLRDTWLRLQGSRQQHEESAPKPARRLDTDSGIGTSLPTSVRQSQQQSSQHLIPVPEDVARSHCGSENKAPTVFSFAPQDGTVGTKFPSQPEDIAFGDAFPCRLCGKMMIKTKTVNVWNREDWISHLTEQHARHRDWDDKTCPFCRESIAQGGRDMIHHVEMHLQDMALTLKPGEDYDDEGDYEGDSRAGSNDSQSRSSPADGVPVIQISSPDDPVASLTLDDIISHPLYMTAKKVDGLWFCPWHGEDFCQHEATAFKEEFGQFILAHLTVFTCKEPGCLKGRQPFSSHEGLRLHIQEAHGSKSPSQKPGRHDRLRFLCTSIGCGRSRPGNGFSNEWVLEDHIKTVHGNLEL